MIDNILNLTLNELIMDNNEGCFDDIIVFLKMIMHVVYVWGFWGYGLWSMLGCYFHNKITFGFGCQTISK